jgi:retron-type reverse transcriptase
MGNLTLAWRNARKGKTQQPNVMEFDRNITQNLLALNEELLNKTYKPRLLISFILRDPKTRIISKSDFRDRVVHHALINILRPIFEKMFIYDSCAGRIGKGTLFALKRFQHFIRKVSHNYKIVRNRFNDHSNIAGYCLKADIKHYFQEVNHNILVDILERKIKDADVIWLLRQILNNVANNNSIENKPNFIMKRERERDN